LTFDASNPFSTQGTGPDLTAVQAIGVQLQVASTWSGVFYVDSVNIVVGGVTSTPTPSPTSTLGNTATSTMSPTPTVTATATWTSTPTATQTATFTNTATPTVTNTATRTVTATFTSTATSTGTPTVTESPTVTDTPTVPETTTITPTPVPGLDIAFPNPNDGTVPVRFCHWIDQTVDQVVLKVYTVSGRKVYQQTCVDDSGDSVSAGQHCYQLDWTQSQLKLADGLYYFVLQENGGLGSKKSMKVLINR